MKVGQFSLKALKISDANNLSRLTHITFVSFLHNLKNNHLGETVMLFFVCFQFYLWIF